MAPQQKGKQDTKGSKQIMSENVGTLSFYRNMSLISGAVSFVVNFLIFSFTTTTVIMTILSFGILLAAYQFMTFMSRPKYAESGGAVLDTGSDLNIEGGIAEHVKDVIILTCGTLALSIISGYFWLVLLLAPIRGIWILWGTLIKPWMDRKNEPEPEVDEKKQKKMERKMRRMR